MISDKTDMFALGITLFEMFTSFSTLMERHIALSELRKTGTLLRHQQLLCADLFLPQAHALASKYHGQNLFRRTFPTLSRDF